ncbi:uncharacterized protein [Diadema setosum]|uniref:uncharacterized protein n=1 Tax=Diadema setosum TaxID=31175 RepID=UPI003B3AA2B0
MTHQEESINFDGHHLRQEQEEELEFEDCHREQELRTLLLKALPDDLLEEDAHSFSTSRETSSLSSHSPELSPHLQSPATSDQDQWNYESDAHQQVSTTEVTGLSLPMQSPAEILLDHEADHTCHLDNMSHQSQTDISYVMGNNTPSDSQDWSLEHQSNGLVIPAPSTIPFSQGLSPTSVAWMEAKQQVDVQINHSHPNFSESDDLSPQGNGHGAVENDVYMYRAPQQLHPGVDFGQRLHSTDTNHRNGKEHDYLWEQDTDENQRLSQHHEPSKTSKTKCSTIRQTHAQNWEQLHEKYNGTLSHPLSNQQMMLKYRGRQHDSNNMDMRAHQDEMKIFSFDTVHQQQQLQERDELDQLQTRFRHAGSDGRDLVQLEILYNARGREIKDLTAQLKLLQEENARERRILNHQLAMLQDEKEGVGTSYQESRKIIDDQSSEIHTLKGEVQALQYQVQSLSESKQQVLSELDTAKATIESLSHQLSEMQRSQPLHRAREQHESLLVGLEQKYSQEMASLREKLDAASNMAQEKSTAVEQLEAQLAASLKVANEARLEHAENVNRLTASLHDSQKRCQELIMQGSLSMMQELQVKLQQANTSKAITDDLCKSLQEELSELKDQLMIYEAAADLGVVSVSGVTSSQSPKTPTDADIVRNLAKEDWKTPQTSRPARDHQPMSPEETLERLKVELSRSLQSIRSKREHVTRLQAELKEAREEGDSHRWKASEAEDKLHQAEAEIETLKRSVSEPVMQACNATASKEFGERLQAELSEKSQECKNLQHQMTVLKTAMAQMVSESDQDKKEEVERCQRTWLQLHEDTSQNLRKQLVSELQAEKDNMEEAHRYQLQEVRNEKSQLEKELHKTKELYLEICEEKKSLEDASKKMEEMCTEAIMQVRVELQEEKQKALDELKVSLEANHRAEVVILQERAKKEKEEEFLQLKAKQEEAVREQECEQKSELSSWRTKYEELEKHMATQIKKAIEEERAAAMGDRAKKEEKENEMFVLTADLKAVQKKYAELEADVVKQVAVAVEAAKEQWIKQEKQKRMSLERETAATIDQMKADHAMQHAEWQSRQANQEEDLSERVTTAVCQAKEEWDKEEKKLRETLAKAMEENSAQEKKAQNQLDKLRQDLEKIKGTLRAAREDERRIHDKYTKLKAKHQKEVSELRDELGLCQAKLHEAERTVQEELNQLQSEMHEANLVTMESMKERVSAIQQKHSILVEQMKAEWEEERRALAKGKKPPIQISVAVQTAASNESDVVVELRQHYLASVENVRASAMSYVTDMQKRCQETLRMAVCEERQHVTAKMHKFYKRQEGKVRQRIISSEEWHSQQNHSPSSRDHPTISKGIKMKHPPQKSAGGTDDISGMNQQLIPARKRNVILSDESLKAHLGTSLTNQPDIDPRNERISLQGVQGRGNTSTPKLRTGLGSSVSQKLSVKEGNNPARHKQHENLGHSADRAVQLSTFPTRQERFQIMARQDQQNMEEKHAQRSPMQNSRVPGHSETMANSRTLRNSSMANANGHDSAVQLRNGHLYTNAYSSNKLINPENKATNASGHCAKKQAQYCDNVSKSCSQSAMHDLSSEGKLSANEGDTTLHESKHPTVCSAVGEDILLPPVNISCESVDTCNTTQRYHHDVGVDVAPHQNHPFLDRDFSQGSKLSKRVLELQSSFLNAQPVRDNDQQRAHSTMEYRSHFTQEVVKSTSVSSKRSHEDSGINSPAYIHQ